MKQWADKVEQLQIRCRECRRIAGRILRGDSFTSAEKRHLEEDVTAVETARARTGEHIWMLNIRNVFKRKREAAEKEDHGQR